MNYYHYCSNYDDDLTLYCRTQYNTLLRFIVGRKRISRQKFTIYSNKIVYLRNSVRDVNKYNNNKHRSTTVDHRTFESKGITGETNLCGLHILHINPCTVYLSSM